MKSLNNFILLTCLLMIAACSSNTTESSKIETTPIPSIESATEIDSASIIENVSSTEESTISLPVINLETPTYTIDVPQKYEEQEYIYYSSFDNKSIINELHSENMGIPYLKVILNNSSPVAIAFVFDSDGGSFSTDDEYILDNEPRDSNGNNYLYYGTLEKMDNTLYSVKGTYLLHSWNETHNTLKYILFSNDGAKLYTSFREIDIKNCSTEFNADDYSIYLN